MYIADTMRAAAACGHVGHAKEQIQDSYDDIWYGSFDCKSDRKGYKDRPARVSMPHSYWSIMWRL